MAEADELAHERKKAQFDVGAMKVVWAGSQYALQVSNRIANLVASDPVFHKDDRPRLSRQELFKKTLRKAAHAWKLFVDLQLSEEEAFKIRTFADEPAYTDLHWVRPNAVALVDAFNHTDHFLGSVLGRYDGNVYPHLYEEALKDPLNESAVTEGYEEHIRPLLKQQFRISRL